MAPKISVPEVYRNDVIEEFLKATDPAGLAAMQRRKLDGLPRVESEEGHFSVSTDRVQEEGIIAHMGQRICVDVRSSHVVHDLVTNFAGRFKGVIIPGTVVTLASSNKRSVRHFFIVENGAGKELKMPDGTKVMCISPESPVAQRLLAKEVGDTIEMANEKAMKIMRVV